MLFSLAAAAAFAAAPASKPPGCTETRDFAVVVADVMTSGEKVLRDELFDEIVEVPAPAMSFELPAERSVDKLSHYFDVLVYKNGGKLKPKSVIVSSMRDEGGRRERWLMLTDLSGRLIKAVVAWDEIDKNGEIRNDKEKGTLSKKKGPFDPDALLHLKYELDIDCITRKKHD